MTSRYYKNRGQEEQNVDDWLMTYADMVTLLLCFFAIFLSVSVPKKAEFAQARQKVLEKFASPNTTEGIFSPMALPRGDFDPVEGSPPVNPDIMRGRPMEVIPLTGYPSIVGNLIDDREAAPKQIGDRITTIDMNSAPFFASGSSTLSDEGKALLEPVLEKINSKKFRNYQITIEGHTDDSPINTLQFPSNWELSTGRSASVVRYFMEQGIPAQRLRASGYADTFPKMLNRDDEGNPIPENQAQNRRVVIKLERIRKGK
ncbi:MAG: OmpA family protein [Alphaproteobacteria bacterium]|nr:OmpA family protein [Alphaproteobacteria bacterium]